MIFVVDTHVLVWSVANPARLTKTARDILVDRDNEILVSAASAWQIATKHRLGKFPEAGKLLDDFGRNLDIAGFTVLPTTPVPPARCRACTRTHSTAC